MNLRGAIRSQVVTFLAIAFALTILVSVAWAGAEDPKGSEMSFGFFVMWAPGVAAIVTCLGFQRNLRGLGWGLGKPIYLVLAYALPLLVGLVTYAVIWSTGAGRFAWVRPFGTNTCGVVGIEDPSYAVAFPVMLTLGLVLRLLFALGEEIGWRGFLVPRLAQLLPAKAAALTSGAIWAAYHLPGLLFLNYYSGSRAKSTVFFSIMAVGASVIMYWIRLRSGSLWTGAVFHASHNLAIQGIFDHFTLDAGNTDFYAGEFGLGLAAAYALTAVWFWRRLDLLPPVRPWRVSEM
jgi:membrane protease YdiL (CAAX protease family)